MGPSSVNFVADDQVGDRLQPAACTLGGGTGASRRRSPGSVSNCAVRSAGGVVAGRGVGGEADEGLRKRTCAWRCDVNVAKKVHVRSSPPWRLVPPEPQEPHSAAAKKFWIISLLRGAAGALSELSQRRKQLSGSKPMPLLQPCSASTVSRRFPPGTPVSEPARGLHLESPPLRTPDLLIRNIRLPDRLTVGELKVRAHARCLLVRRVRALSRRHPES